MNVIVNVDAQWAIGYQGQLLFPIREDLKRFARLTTGKVVVMGRATLESLPGGKPLKNRENIVLSKSILSDQTFNTKEKTGTTPDNLSFCNSIDALHSLLASPRFAEYIPADIFVIGGQSIYEQLISECDTAYITKVVAVASKTDAFFPNLDTRNDWQPTETSELFFQGSTAYRYITYKKL